MKSVPGALHRWTTAESVELYGLENWANGYFHASDDGEVEVSLGPGANPRRVSLVDIVAGMKARGMSLPVLLRFGDLLESRVAMLNQCFAKAIRDVGYQGSYRGVFPIKVNQQQQVIEEVTSYGRQYHHGLEAGSKAELIAALAYLQDPEAYIVCNGYKDQAFIDLALYGLKMGKQVILVVEIPSELSLILERAEALGIRPRIGARVKLATRGNGHWTESGGDRSVFGLNTAQLIDVVDRLREVDMLDCLEMLHYHVGSQIPTIRTIRSAVNEAARVYANLVHEGARMGLLNIGGGLAVDYDGTHTNFASSSNYGVPEYCADVVEAVLSVVEDAGIAHPTLISESGRATVAYYSVLVFNVLDVCPFESHAIPDELPVDACEWTQNLQATSKALNSKNLQECYHDALYYRDELRSLFVHGGVKLRERALAEQIFWSILGRIVHALPNLKHVPEELQNLDSSLADVYYGNFSLFQSIPDAWAIDQLFPVMPIHRLDQEPLRTGVIADCTCDCDGKIDRFIDSHGVRKGLPLHAVADGEEYLLGVFLIGAYQETLGDLHNLFGDTNVVSIRLDEDGEIDFTREIVGDSVSDVLSYVEYDPKNLIDLLRAQAELAVRRRTLSAQERRDIMTAFDRALRGSTYYECEG